MIKYKTNKEEFKVWFNNNQNQLLIKLNSRKQLEVKKLLESKLNKVLNGVAFELFKDDDSDQWIIEFNTLLDSLKKIVCYDFCNDIQVQGWQFRYYHHASLGMIYVDNKPLFAKDLSVVITDNKIKRNFDFNIMYNDVFDNKSEKEVFSLLYMLLVDVVGEIVVDAYLGSFQLVKGLTKYKYRFQEKINLNETYEYMNEKCKKLSWTPPKDIKLIAEHYGRNVKSYEDRQDISEGSTYCIDLMNEENENYTPNRDFIKNCNIGLFTFSQFVGTIKDKDEKKTLLKNVELQISKLINDEGFIVNCGQSKTRFYIDFLVFDLIVVDKIIHHYQENDSIKIYEI